MQLDTKPIRLHKAVNEMPKILNAFIKLKTAVDCKYCNYNDKSGLFHIHAHIHSAYLI